jgi:hypothetical protein
MGGFVNTGGKIVEGSNRRVIECSIYRCGQQEDTDSNSKGDGGCAVSTDRNLITLYSINFSQCSARSDSDRVPVISLAYDQQKDQSSVNEHFLLIVECKQGTAAIGFQKGGVSSISDSVFLNNSVTSVIRTEVSLTVKNGTFSGTQSVLSVGSSGSVTITGCYLTSQGFTDERITATQNEFGQPEVSLQGVVVGISYCPALPRVTQSVATDTLPIAPSLSSLFTPSLFITDSSGLNQTAQLRVTIDCFGWVCVDRIDSDKRFVWHLFSFRRNHWFVCHQ